MWGSPLWSDNPPDAAPRRDQRLRGRVLEAERGQRRQRGQHQRVVQVPGRVQAGQQRLDAARGAEGRLRARAGEPLQPSAGARL